MILRNPSSRRDFLFVTCLFLCCFFTLTLSSQGVNGIVKESTSNMPVENGFVSVLRGDSILASLTTDSSGKFYYSSKDAIRVRFSITGPGYKAFISEEIVLDGFSTIRLECYLERISFELGEVTVTSSSSKSQPYLYRVTKDDLSMVAGNFDDPVRVVMSEPGIVQINDQANHIAVRGQNPLFNSWYLEGLEIVNPNHTNNAGTFSDQPTQSGGGVNMFSAQVLGRTDVYAGLNPLSLGRSAGAVIDMHLHESAKPEYRAKAGFLGFEFGGSQGVGAKGFLDVNLRYSFTGLLANLGVDFGGEKIGFYDGVISYHQQGLRHKLKVFGWAGRSTNEFNRVESPEEIEKYKDFFDIDFESDILGAGLRYEYALSRKMSIRSGAAYSLLNSNYTREGQFGPSPVFLHVKDNTRILSSIAELFYQLSPSVETSAGLNYLYKAFPDEMTAVAPFREESFLRPYINTNIDLSSHFSFDLGGELNYAFSAGSDAASVYPGYRATIQWASEMHHLIYAGIRHAAGQNIQTFGPEEEYNLPLLVDKFELGWILAGKQHHASIKTFLQEIKNMPVFDASGGVIHLADHAGPIFQSAYLSGNNEGEARYYGIEGEWAYRNDKGIRLAANQTVYKSSRRAGEAEFTGGRFDGRYITHISFSKEIIRVRKEKNRIWNFSLRGIFQDGLWEPSIDENNSAQAENTVYTDPGIFNQQLPAYKRIDAGVSRTIANAKVRWRYGLDIQNLFGFTNTGYRYYDPFLQEITDQEQLGIIPVFSIQASW